MNVSSTLSTPSVNAKYPLPPRVEGKTTSSYFLEFPVHSFCKITIMLLKASDLICCF